VCGLVWVCGVVITPMTCIVAHPVRACVCSRICMFRSDQGGRGHERRRIAARPGVHPSPRLRPQSLVRGAILFPVPSPSSSLLLTVHSRVDVFVNLCMCALD
jgi:hypothetical protein